MYEWVIDKDFNTEKDEKFSWDQLLKNSEAFSQHIGFPTQDNLIKNLASSFQIQQEIQQHARETRPIMSYQVLSFLSKFLTLKKKFGSTIERECYQDMDVSQFINRLIQKRPLVFTTHQDSYVLRDGKKGYGGFEFIGTPEESTSLCLKDYQSYFEMSLSSFLSVFVPTHFINSGNRENCGVAGTKGTYESKGIFVGMVGARFEKPGLMEWVHMVVSKQQNTAANGYGDFADPKNPKTIELRLWADLYESRLGKECALPDYDEAFQDQSDRYLDLLNGSFLDTFVYQQHLKLIIEPFLLECNRRAKQKRKKAYLHIVGLGLGVWLIDHRQKKLMLDVYAELLQKYCLEHISDIHFSWFGDFNKCGKIGHEGFLDSRGHPIKIHFSNRNPADKLQGQDAGKFLIAQYAWDSNSYPGNEYWEGFLTSSGDPAAACCSTIGELQNPQINPFVNARYLSVPFP